MSRPRKLVYHGHSEYDELDRCFWCGKPTRSRDYIVNPGGDPVIKCCCQDHYDLALDFIERDARARKPFWLVLFVLCLLNLVALGFEAEGFFGYLPLTGIAVAVLVHPSLLTRYALYTRFGLVRTRSIFRVLAAVVALLALFSALATMGG